MGLAMVLILTKLWLRVTKRAGVPGGVIGNTRDFGSLVPGSSPGRVAFTSAKRKGTYGVSRRRWLCRGAPRVSPNRPLLTGWRVMSPALIAVVASARRLPFHVIPPLFSAIVAIASVLPRVRPVTVPPAPARFDALVPVALASCPRRRLASAMLSNVSRVALVFSTTGWARSYHECEDGNHCQGRCCFLRKFGSRVGPARFMAAGARACFWFPPQKGQGSVCPTVTGRISKATAARLDDSGPERAVLKERSGGRGERVRARETGGHCSLTRCFASREFVPPRLTAYSTLRHGVGQCSNSRNRNLDHVVVLERESRAGDNAGAGEQEDAVRK